jgi:hypothetical protein
MRCDRESFRWRTTIITLIVAGVTSVDSRSMDDVSGAEPLAPPGSSRTYNGDVSTLGEAVAAFNRRCAHPIPNAPRLAPQAR